MTTEAREWVVRRYVAEPTLSNRNAVITAHQYLCRRGARKFFRGTVDRSDLEQIAAIGLIKASQRYSRAYDTPFEAYAWLMIVGELMHFVRDQERPIRVPRHLRGLEAHYTAAYEALSARREREPSPLELAREMQVSPKVVDELRALRARADGAANAAEGIPAQAESFSVEDRLALGTALRHLTNRELTIIRGIFGQERSQAEIGREIGVSQRQVSRILQRSLERLGRLIAG